jgi:hypothetical protein
MVHSLGMSRGSKSGDERLRFHEPDAGKRGRIAFALAAGFLLGGIAGCAVRSLLELDPLIRWFFAGSFLFFGAGACFIRSFYQAEREHELRLAACFGTRDAGGRAVPRGAAPRVAAPRGGAA